MDKEHRPFTFEDDFQLVPMDAGSYLLEQGLGFSRAFSNLDQVIDFLINEKDQYLNTNLYPNDYEPFDHTGLKKEEGET